jgi:hypothetical protein
MSVQAMLRTAFWAQNQGSYQAAENILADECKISVNDDTIRQVTNFIGSLVFDEDKRKAREAYGMLNKCKLSHSSDKPGILYIQTDGAALNTRHKDSDDSTWRENKLGLVFSSDNLYFWTDKRGIRQHQIRKKEYTSFIGGVDDFKQLLFACAVRNGYGTYKKTIILSDGAAWIHNMAGEIFPDALCILDFFHMSENVYTFAKCLFKMDPGKYVPWAEDISASLKNSEYNKVLAELKQYKEKPLSGTVNLYHYIQSNTDRIDYKSYKDQGYFIGSGAIESANKTVLQRRLKQAGMRWNTTTAQYLLTLRTKQESGLWEKDVVKFVLSHFKLL